MSISTNFLDAIKPLSPGLKKYLHDHLQRETFLKKELLIREGFVCQKLWFVAKGLIGRQFETGGNEGYTGFTKENELLITTDFIQQQSQTKTLIALEDSLCYYLTYRELIKICQCFPEFHYHLQKIAEAELIRANTIRRAFYRQSPRAKYQYILNNEPWMVQRLSLKDIAMYIGVNKDVLSRVRGDFRSS